MHRSRALASAVAVLGLGACSHNEPPPGKEWLAAVQFAGNQYISDDDLLAGLALHRTLEAKRELDPYLVQVDADRLRGQYARAGFFDVDVQARVERKQDATTVIYTIREGPRSTTRVEITGLPNDPDLAVRNVREALPLGDGAPFDYEKYDLAKEKLLDVAKNAGYAHAKLDASVVADLTARTATIRLAYTTGPKCKFGTVAIAGVEGDLHDAVANRLKFAPGDQYSTSALTATQRELYGMGRFSTVQVQPDQGGAEVVNVTVAVTKNAARQITLGGGFGIDPISYEARARAGTAITGFPTPMDTLTLDFRPAYAYLRDGGGFEPRIRALARLDRQDLFLTYAVGSVEVDYNYLAYEAFTNYGPLARLGYEVRLGTPRVRVRAGWKIEHYDFRDISPLIDPALQAQIHINHNEQNAAFEQSLIADGRDHPLEPRLGVYAELKVSEGTPFLGSSYSYRELAPELRGYVPVGDVVLAARARFGAIWGDVPPTERFFAGGANSNRGFAERQLSPSVTGVVDGDLMTVPYGGAGLIDTSFEARFPITSIKEMPLGGAVFVDGGDVTNTPDQLTLSSLCWAAGAGLRLLTIVGPVRTDFGYRLNRTAPDDPQPGSTWSFHLSLGEAF